MAWAEKVSSVHGIWQDFEHRLFKRAFLKMMSLTAGVMKRFYSEKRNAQTLIRNHGAGHAKTKRFIVVTELDGHSCK